MILFKEYNNVCPFSSNSSIIKELEAGPQAYQGQSIADSNSGHFQPMQKLNLE